MSGSARRERVMVFVDGSNIFWGCREREIKIDNEKLKDTLVGPDRELRRPYYYCAKPVPDRKGQIRFREKLRYCGYDVIAKPLRNRIFNAKSVETGDNVRVEKMMEKGVDVALVVDMLAMAYKDAYDTAILVGGDEDYLSAIKEIKGIGKRVEVAAFSDTDDGDPPKYKSTINREMKMTADVFIPLENIIDQIKLE